MLNAIIDWSIRNRFLVILATAFTVAAGYWSVRTTPVDAIPDISDVQIIVQTEWPEQAPEIVEDQVTYPLTTTLLSVPGAAEVRGTSAFGVSYVTILFEEGTDLYWARSRVLEYLQQAESELPDGVTPELGPDGTGVGWVYQYYLQSDEHDLAELRSLQDFFVRYQLQGVQGVAEVASYGGYRQQYHVDTDPQRLEAYGLSIQDVSRRVGEANADAGARVVEASGREYMVRGLGYLEHMGDIENVVLRAEEDGTPVRVDDVADVGVGPGMRRGMADLNGQGDVVSGIVVMSHGENALRVIDDVKAELQEIALGLPEGVSIETAYDRSGLIEEAIANLQQKIVEILLVVLLIAGLFLLHLRSSLVVALTLPVAVLLAFVVMRVLGVHANIMSLGGIALAIGAMVDAAVVQIDNVHKHLEREGEGELTAERRWEVVRNAAQEVGPALFFCLLLIAVSFLPIFALEAEEGRLFRPLAFTTTFSLGAAALLAVTLLPVTLGYFIRGRVRSGEQNPITRGLVGGYRPLLQFVLGKRWLLLTGAAVVLALTVIPFQRLGSEFMPPVEEGTALFMPMTLPGVSIQQAAGIMRYQNEIISDFPEVESVIGKAGRAETATDPAPLEMFETIVNFKPVDEWRDGVDYDSLVAEMDEATQMPGVMNIWTMPIQNRVEMLATGMRTPVGVQVFGPDLDEIERIGREIEGLLQEVPGTRSAVAQRGASGYYLDVDVDREAAARHGLNVADVHSALSMGVGGAMATQTVEGLERYDVQVRYPRNLRQSPEALEQVRVATANGTVPLGQVASIEHTRGPMMVETESAFPVSRVFVDVEGRDLGGYVEDAQDLLGEHLELPAGYTVEWAGQYESMERVRERLSLVIPLTLLAIFVLLFLYFRNLPEVIIVLSTLPFALAGGFWLLWLLGYNTSVAVWVGIIAMGGVAAEIGVVMLVYLNREYRLLREERGRPLERREILEAALEGATSRVRPIMMTVVSTIAGLMPLMWAVGAGADTMKRIAAPMIGGLVTAMVLALFIVPATYTLWREWQNRREAREEEAMAS